ncbi:Thioredoxin domain-containing protein [Abeliophyllum distichum]|uniref:Thioredoxin domain-containing protein n=1 Tax=Abeliophyllum distichum TaxID=126358 RepID=A0ABD1T2P2_9LAMI
MYYPCAIPIKIRDIHLPLNLNSHLTDFQVAAMEKFIEKASIPIVTIFDNDPSNHPYDNKFSDSPEAKTTLLIIHKPDGQKLAQIAPWLKDYLVKRSDTPNVESGSKVEDIASPKTIRNYSYLRLTPIREEVCQSL